MFLSGLKDAAQCSKAVLTANMPTNTKPPFSSHPLLAPLHGSQLSVSHSQLSLQHNSQVPDQTTAASDASTSVTDSHQMAGEDNTDVTAELEGDVQGSLASGSASISPVLRAASISPLPSPEPQMQTEPQSQAVAELQSMSQTQLLSQLQSQLVSADMASVMGDSAVPSIQSLHGSPSRLADPSSVVTDTDRELASVIIAENAEAGNEAEQPSRR